MSDSDDDKPQLSAEALAALQEFYTEQQSKDENDHKEDWQLSQFWYSDATSERLAKEAMAVAGEYGRIACLSCPTLYKKLITMKKETCTTVVLEYDRRFASYGDDFIFYDYNDPLALPSDLKGSFDLVVADPPFLAEECLRKTTETIKFLAKDKVLLCTGAVMEGLAKELLNASICTYKPQHDNNLANEFRCYVNYETQTLNKE